MQHPGEAHRLLLNTVWHILIVEWCPVGDVEGSLLWKEIRERKSRQVQGQGEKNLSYELNCTLQDMCKF
jgi:hypothetical protein